MNSIYTSNGSLVVEEVIWSGVRKHIKNQDGSYEHFYKVNGSEKFKKTGWGNKAKESFNRAFNEIKKSVK